MSALTRRSEPTALIPRIGSRNTQPTRLPPRVAREVERANHGGLIGSARVQAGAYVTHVAMQQVAMLSAEEGQLIDIAPLADRRLKVLVDQFTANAAFEIQRMGW